MKVAWHLVEQRRERLAALLRQHRYLPINELCRRLEVSEATARRDLAALASENKITRTYGGALLDFNNDFASFEERRLKAQRAKRKIGQAAVQQLKAGDTCYIDAGTTMMQMADALRNHPMESLTIVTNNLPVAEALAGVEGFSVHLIGGMLLQRQSALLGDKACRNVRTWKFDIAFLGAEGMNAGGIYNSQKDVVRFQRAVSDRANRVACCLDASKLGHETPEFLFSWTSVDLLLTDARLELLRKNDISIDRDKVVSV